MYEKAKTYTLERPRLKKTMGWVLVTIGFVALIAPIIPGAPIIFVGLELLGLRYLFVERFIKRKRTEVIE